ncbi:Coiled-coil domain-containing protein [Canna indica]|uniref:Coiled-coil domain-containing protein n=1 Tax=Canna indica TaxID=4628 RepID=A0AAQ3KW32_9LILI|nr:Coiled-coil domain-containing protein [Canna indica]
MERLRAGSPVYTRQKSISSSSGAPQSPTGMSPVHPQHLHNRHARSGSTGVGAFRRAQNNAARAAAQRLARVMASQHDEDDDDEEDEDELSGPPIDLLSTPRRGARSQSPAINRFLADQSPARPSAAKPAVATKPITMIPPIRSTQKPLTTTVGSDSLSSGQRSETTTPMAVRRDKMVSVDLGSLSVRQHSSVRSYSRLQDEIDVPQDENENNREKLRLAEEKCDEADLKAGRAEKQVLISKNLVSTGLFRVLISRLFFQAAAKAAAQTNNAKRDTTMLRWEGKTTREEATSVPEHRYEAESEIRSLRTMAHKMMLSQELMEEVVLKRCWLARYWKLCVDYGIYADIAETKYEYWSSFSPLPLEVVLSAGQKARDEHSSDNTDLEEDKMVRNANDMSGEGNIESMLLVEKGLRELSSLKVEEAVLITMAQHRRENTKSGQLVDGQNPAEAFELSQEESEEVLFKQAWLTYLWRRAKNHGLEEDIADERLEFWIEQSNHSPTSHDAIEVERGLVELRKLGIEWQLWEVCHHRHQEI